MRPRHFFSAVIEDPPLAAVDLAVWVNHNDTHIQGYLEDGKRTHNALWSNPPAGVLRHFVEGSDGWHYGVFLNPNNGFYTDLKKFKVGKTSVTDVTDIGTFPQFNVLDSALDQNPVNIGPDGTLYFRVISLASYSADFLLAKQRAPWGDKYMKWTLLGGFQDAGVIPAAWSNHIRFAGEVCGGLSRYKTEVIVVDTLRRIATLILKTGRWIGAETIPGDGTISAPGREGIGPVVSCQIPSNEGCDDPDASFVTCTIRVTGNAWWEKAAAADAWVNVVNGGLTSVDRSYSKNLFGGGFTFVDTELGVTAPDPFIANRKTRTLTEYLPTIRFNMKIGTCVSPIPETNSPWQGDPLLEVDGQSIFYMVRGAADHGGIFKLGGIHKAAIPGVGVNPSWSSLGISETNINIEGGTTALAVSRKRLWVAIVKEVPVSGRLRHYAKDGSGMKEITGVVPRGATPAWKARWK